MRRWWACEGRPRHSARGLRLVGDGGRVRLGGGAWDSPVCGGAGGAGQGGRGRCGGLAVRKGAVASWCGGRRLTETEGAGTVTRRVGGGGGKVGGASWAAAPAPKDSRGLRPPAKHHKLPAELAPRRPLPRLPGAGRGPDRRRAAAARGRGVRHRGAAARRAEARDPALHAVPWLGEIRSRYGCGKSGGGHPDGGGGAGRPQPDPCGVTGPVYPPELAVPGRRRVGRACGRRGFWNVGARYALREEE